MGAGYYNRVFHASEGLMQMSLRSKVESLRSGDSACPCDYTTGRFVRQGICARRHKEKPANQGMCKVP